MENCAMGERRLGDGVICWVLRFTEIGRTSWIFRVIWDYGSYIARSTLLKSQISAIDQMMIICYSEIYKKCKHIG